MKDPVKKFENSLPFNRINVKDMMTAIDIASEGKDSVSLENLRKALPTEAWADLDNADSRLVKVLKSDVFKQDIKDDEGNDVKMGENDLSVEYLKLWSLIHCDAGKKKQNNKAKELYNILQDGGLEAHE